MLRPNLMELSAITSYHPISEWISLSQLFKMFNIIRFAPSNTWYYPASVEQAATIRQEPVNTGSNSALNVTFKENSNQRSNLMLRSALPTPERIALSANRLVMRTGVSKACILSAAETYKNRSQLRDDTPESFANKWSELLNLPITEVEDFLVDACYFLRC